MELSNLLGQREGKLFGNKVLMFGIIGAIGCLLGAIIGEILLAAIPKPRPPAKYVCLLIDGSGSMGRGAGSKLEEVKAAANTFVAEQDLSHNRIGVIAFSDGASVASPLSGDSDSLQRAIDTLPDGGGTNMTDGLQAAAGQLPAAGEQDRYILIFTDGDPNSEYSALDEAEQCRQQGIDIVAIATSDADSSYLERLTGDPTRVISASVGSFSDSFRDAERIIYRDLIGDETGFLGVALWTAMITLGVSLALVIAQNWYLKRPHLRLNEGVLVTIGGLAAGIVAGILGQLLFLPFQGAAYVEFLGRIIGWTILGALVGRGMAFFVPNLNAGKAPIAGALGGAIGAIGFMFAAGLVFDIAGRLLGAAILGFAIGLLIALVEMAFREAWLEVRFGAKEVVHVSLGAQPVRIGSDSRCAVFARGARSIACQYELQDGNVRRTDFATEQTSTVESGFQEEIGNVTVTVRGGQLVASESEADDTTAAPTGGQSLPAGPPPPPPTKGATAGESPAKQQPASQSRSDTPAKGPASSLPAASAKGSPPPPPPPPSKSKKS